MSTLVSELINNHDLMDLWSCLQRLKHLAFLNVEHAAQTKSCKQGLFNLLI